MKESLIYTNKNVKCGWIFLNNTKKFRLKYIERLT